MKKIIFICASLFLTSCQSIDPPFNFTVSNVSRANKKINAEIKSITVRVNADEATGEAPIIINGVALNWQNAIIDAINKKLIFKDDAKQKLNLSVKINALDVPVHGLSYTTNADAIYVISDRETGQEIYKQNIVSTATVPLDFAFQGQTRRLESINKAVQKNITQFLSDLDKLNLN